VYRERLTVTLNPELVKAVDTLIDRRKLRNRSHAIEHLIQEGLSLHQFGQVFFYIGREWTQEQLAAALETCASSNVFTLWLCPLGEGVREADAQAILGQDGRFTWHAVPGQFGSGGALLLKKEELRHPFAAIWIGVPGLPARYPTSLLPAYAYHRQQPGLATLVLATGPDHTYPWSGTAILHPDLLGRLPVGPADLASQTFPQLAKEGTLNTYVEPTLCA
jgi:hypothetical protein